MQRDEININRMHISVSPSALVIAGVKYVSGINLIKFRKYPCGNEINSVV